MSLSGICARRTIEAEAPEGATARHRRKHPSLRMRTGAEVLIRKVHMPVGAARPVRHAQERQRRGGLARDRPQHAQVRGGARDAAAQVQALQAAQDGAAAPRRFFTGLEAQLP